MTHRIQWANMTSPVSQSPSRKSVGALVFVFAQSDGSYGVVSTDGKCEGWSSESLDQAWKRYYARGARILRKIEKARDRSANLEKIIAETETSVGVPTDVIPDDSGYIEA